MSSERPSQLWLFLCLSSMFLAFPYFSKLGVEEFALNLVFSAAVVLSLLNTTSLPRIFYVLYAVCSAAALTSSFLFALAWTNQLPMVVSYIVFFGASTVIQFHHLLTETEISADTLLGAVCNYILLGLFFASVFSMLLIIDPEALNIPKSETHPIYRVVYFSFTTLTTVGYGDVTPISEAAQMLAVYEGIIGQIFIAAVMGVLVGTHVSDRQRRNSQEAANIEPSEIPKTRQTKD